MRLSIYLIACLLTTTLRAGDSDKFEVFSYKTECRPQRTIDEFFDAVEKGYELKCNSYDTLLDSEDVHMPYQNITVIADTVILQSIDKNFKITNEFTFDTLTTSFSPLHFLKAWNQCGDTVFGDTSREVRFYLNCTKIKGLISIDSKDYTIKQNLDTITIKNQYDWSSFYIIKIPIRALNCCGKTYFRKGIPDSGKPRLLNGGLGFFDTTIIKDTYDGSHGLSIYIQKNHKTKLYSQIDCKFKNISKDQDYVKASRNIKKNKHKINNLNKLPTQWIQLFPYDNDFFFSIQGPTVLNDIYRLDECLIIHFDSFGRPEFQMYNLKTETDNSMNFKHSLLDIKNDTIGYIVNLDSLNKISLLSISGKKKVFVPRESITNFDIIIQETNCERPEMFSFEDVDVNETIKKLKNKNIKYLFILN